MLLTIDHVEEHRRAVRTLPTGQIILGERPQQDGLRRDAEAPGRERRRDVERLLLRSTGLEDAFATARRRRRRRGGPVLDVERRRRRLPGDADVTHAEVVGRGDREGERVGVEQDRAAGGEARRVHRGGRVVARHDPQLERPCPGEAVAIRPRDRHARLAPGDTRRRTNRGLIREGRDPVHLGRDEGPIGGHDERDRAADDGRERAAADVLALHSRALEVLRQADLRLDARDLRTEQRLEGDALPRVTDGHRERHGLELGRQREDV